MKNKIECLIAPCTGKTVPLSAVPDEVFANGILGEGIAIEPAEGHFFAPVEGTVSSVADARHAYTVLSDAGVDVLATLEKLKGRIACTHLKDYAIKYVEKDGKKEFKPTFAPVGCGNMDFAAIVQKMRECGAEYYFVEQDNAADQPDTLGEVEQSVRYIKNNL